MLIGVVENNQIDHRVDAQQFVDARYAILAYGHHDLSVELMVNLESLVADVARCRALRSKHEPFGMTFVAAAEHRNMVAVAHRLNDVFDVRCFACASDSKISHDDDRHIEFMLLE